MRSDHLVAMNTAEVAYDLTGCLAAVRRNEEEGTRELVKQLYPLVIKIVRSHLPRRMDEEDLAQVIFLKIFRHFGQYKAEVPFQHWVSRIAVNSCLNELRAEKVRPEIRMADMSEEEAAVMEHVLTVGTEPRPGEEMGAREIAEKLLQTLNPADRLIISLMDLEERTVAEIKEMTGWNASLIKVRAFRARLKLRANCKRLMREGKL